MVLRFHRAHFNFLFFEPHSTRYLVQPYIPVPGRPLSAYYICIDTGIDTVTGTGTGTGYFLVLVTDRG